MLKKKKQKSLRIESAQLSNNLPFINRELSWLDFNMRVLEEAFDLDNPPLEKLKFLSISASNLDEFFMVRVAGIRQQVSSGITRLDPAGLTPKKQLSLISKRAHIFMHRQYECLEILLAALAENGIMLLHPHQWSYTQRQAADEYYRQMLLPVLTPLAVDNGRPFPVLGNRSIYFAAALDPKDSDEDRPLFALVQIPQLLPRLISLPSDEGDAYALIDDIIKENLDDLFAPHDLRSAYTFRITRSSDLEIDDGATDLILEIERSIKKRKRGRPVRLELQHGCDGILRDFLIDRLKINSRDIYELPDFLDLSALQKYSAVEGHKNLSLPQIEPAPCADFVGCTDYFAAIRERDRLVHHPYESFSSVVDFISQAADDESVLAIKQTLYRVSGNSPIISSLIKAAENGKQVTVLVELRARFDEEKNIQWARKLERAGCHVIYGLPGLKIHCKLLLVIRREGSGLRRYMHMGTGNYNDITAKTYTDMGFFTADEVLGSDASLLFNVLTGHAEPRHYDKLVAAPLGLRPFLARMIKNEINNAIAGKNAAITIKANALIDPEMIELLYNASQAGVKIRLLVRGMCCLVPGVPGISDNIIVISIVGQLLEHTRVFIFENGGDRRIYLGSADIMQRNLDTRVELLFPIEDGALKKRIETAMAIMLLDTVNARVMLSDGSYRQLLPSPGEEPLNSHRTLSQRAWNEYSSLKSSEKSNAESNFIES